MENAKEPLPQGPWAPLPSPFVDNRGEIQPLVEELMRSAVLIQSKKGAIRGNHYHKTDWHYCYMLSGAMQYYWRPTESPLAPQKLTAGKGTMIFTPPMTDHAMQFLEDTVWLTLSRNPRDQKSYEQDIVRISLINGQNF